MKPSKVKIYWYCMLLVMAVIVVLGTVLYDLEKLRYPSLGAMIFSWAILAGFFFYTGVCVRNDLKKVRATRKNMEGSYRSFYHCSSCDGLHLGNTLKVLWFLYDRPVLVCPRCGSSALTTNLV
jgi:hypothetical protein